MYQFMASTGPLLEGLFHCTVFFTQNGTLVIKFDKLIFRGYAILLYMTRISVWQQTVPA